MILRIHVFFSTSVKFLYIFSGIISANMIPPCKLLGVLNFMYFR